MKRLPLIDDAFLRLESRRQPLHIGMLLLFEPPNNAPEDFAARIAGKLRQSVSAVDLFNRRLVERRGMHYWEENDDFDLEHHFVHLALPRPGRIRELLDMVSRLHCGHLDRAYPLWRMYLIEGIEDGRIAVYMKIHHALIDGMGGMELLMSSMATARADSKKLPPFWEIKRPRKQSGQLPVIPAPATTGLFGVRAAAREGWRSAMPVIRKLRNTFKQYQAKNPDVAMVGEAPKSIFNEPISGTRRFAAQSYSTARIKRIARKFDATSNDVILAMVGGACRQYLQTVNALPKMPLTAGVPVSVRGKGGSGGEDAANEVAFTVANLATNIDDPAERLLAIKRSMDYNKAQLQGLSSGQMQAYASLSLIPGALNVLLGRKPENALGNVVVSHVPGPKKTLYWHGAKLTGIYPISLLVAGSGLNITIISRPDTVDFGIIACRKTVPHAQRLLDYLEDALMAMEKSIGAAPKTVRGKKSGTKKPTSKKSAAPKKAASRRAKKSTPRRKPATPRA